jgi:hypothetical protein
LKPFLTYSENNTCRRLIIIYIYIHNISPAREFGVIQNPTACSRYKVDNGWRTS